MGGYYYFFFIFSFETLALRLESLLNPHGRKVPIGDPTRHETKTLITNNFN